MSTIASIHLHQVTAPLRRPFVTAVRTAQTLDTVLVEVRDTDGRRGWGEAPTSWRVTGESAPSVLAAIQGPLSMSVLGAPTNDPLAASIGMGAAIVGNNAAKMALDCALYDLAAQEAGVPLWSYLGAQDGVVTTDMTLSVASGQDGGLALLDDAQGFLAAGFSSLKIKVDAQTPLPQQLHALRERVGAAVAIRIDANQAWSVDQAVAVTHASQEAGADLEYVEQPVHRDDVAGLAEVARRTSVPVMADESVWDVRQFYELLSRGRVSAINVKLAKTGGIRRALELAAAARVEGVGVFVGSMLESSVGVGAAASLAAAVSTAVTHDLDSASWLQHPLVDDDLQYAGNTIHLTRTPGLGIRGLRER